MNERADATWIARSREETLFAALYQRHYRAIRDFCRRRVPRDVVDDVVDDIPRHSPTAEVSDRSVVTLVERGEQCLFARTGDPCGVSPFVHARSMPAQPRRLRDSKFRNRHPLAGMST